MRFNINLHTTCTNCNKNLIQKKIPNIINLILVSHFIFCKFQFFLYFLFLSPFFWLIQTNLQIFLISPYLKYSISQTSQKYHHSRATYKLLILCKRWHILKGAQMWTILAERLRWSCVGLCLTTEYPHSPCDDVVYYGAGPLTGFGRSLRAWWVWSSSSSFFSLRASFSSMDTAAVVEELVLRNTHYSSVHQDLASSFPVIVPSH